MSSKNEQDRHVQKAYEVALFRKTEKKVLEDEKRLLRKNLANLSNPDPQPCDFPGCVE